MKGTRALITAGLLVIGAAACGGGGGATEPVASSTTSPSEFIPTYSNKCEEDVSRIISTTLLDNTMDSVRAEWGDDSPLVPVFQAMYDELKPAFNVGAVGVGIRYIAEYSINVCKDNDVFNAVLRAGKGDAAYRDGCLDGKMPDVNETLKDCTEGVQATTTTTVG